MSKLYNEAFKLKTEIRKGWLLKGACDKKTGRYESDAEHTFSMAILALEIINKKKLKLNVEKVLKMILYHELCEAKTGDHTPAEKIPPEVKKQAEEKAVAEISYESGMPEILELFKEFMENKTKEAQFVKKMDKLDAIVQSKIYAREHNKSSIYKDFYNNAKDIADEFIEFID